MRKVDTDALELVARALRIGNPATATEPVDFDDAVLQQVLNVTPMVRRAGEPSTGMYAGFLQNVHTIPGDLETTIDFYDLVAGTTVAPPFPTTRQSNLWDVWIFGPITGIVSAAATLDSAMLDVVFQNERTLPVLGAIGHRLAIFSGDVDLGGEIAIVMQEAFQGRPMVDLPAYRIQPGTELRWLSRSGVGAVTASVTFAIGVFPRATGQDAIGAG